MDMSRNDSSQQKFGEKANKRRTNPNQEISALTFVNNSLSIIQSIIQNWFDLKKLKLDNDDF